VDCFSILLRIVARAGGFDRQEKYQHFPLVLNHQAKTLPSINVLLKYLTWCTEAMYLPNKIYRE
jgi:hypothetical protein